MNASDLLPLAHDLLTGPVATALAAGVSARLGLAVRVQRTEARLNELEADHQDEPSHAQRLLRAATTTNNGATAP